MSNNNILKSATIVGEGMQADDYSGALNIGNQEDGVTINNIRSALNKKIDSNTIITINAHGTIFFGSHVLHLNNGYSFEYTSEVLSLIKEFAPDTPLQISLDSCYSGNAKEYVHYLSDGSVLITNSKENEVTLANLRVHSLESNPYIRFINQLPFKAASYSSFNTKSGKFEIEPKHECLLSKENARNFLEKEVKRFVEFSKDKFWNDNKVELPNIEFSDEQIDIFVRSFFTYECLTNSIFAEFLENHIVENKYLKESINYVFSDGFNPLHAASYMGHTDVVKLLIEAGADADKARDDGVTPLYAATYKGHTDVVKLLIEAGADADKAKDNGVTPLFIAAENGHSEVVKLLIESGADVNKARDDGATPLYVASYMGHTDVVKLLLDNAADADKAKNNEVTPLYVASQEGHTELVKLLLESGADVNKSADDGRTPLFVASHEGHTELVKLLIESGADANKARGDGITPLILASQEGHFEVVKLLLKSGADINKARDSGVTPLFKASQEGHFEVVKLLLESGADADKAIDNGVTPLHAASYMGHTDAVKLLIESGADVNKARDNDTTPLLLASQEGHFEVVRLLIESGADVNKARDDGATPFDAATHMGHTEIVNLLQKHIEESKYVDADHATLTQDYHDSSNHDYMGEAADHADEL